MYSLSCALWRLTHRWLRTPAPDLPARLWTSFSFLFAFPSSGSFPAFLPLASFTDLFAIPRLLYCITPRPTRFFPAPDIWLHVAASGFPGRFLPLLHLIWRRSCRCAAADTAQRHPTLPAPPLCRSLVLPSSSPRLPGLPLSPATLPSVPGCSRLASTSIACFQSSPSFAVVMHLPFFLSCLSATPFTLCVPLGPFSSPSLPLRACSRPLPSPVSCHPCLFVATASSSFRWHFTVLLSFFLLLSASAVFRSHSLLCRLLHFSRRFLRFYTPLTDGRFLLFLSPYVSPPSWFPASWVLSCFFSVLPLLLASFFWCPASLSWLPSLFRTLRPPLLPPLGIVSRGAVCPFPAFGSCCFLPPPSHSRCIQHLARAACFFTRLFLLLYDGLSSLPRCVSVLLLRTPGLSWICEFTIYFPLRLCLNYFFLPGRFCPPGCALFFPS